MVFKKWFWQKFVENMYRIEMSRLYTRTRPVNWLLECTVSFDVSKIRVVVEYDAKGRKYGDIWVWANTGNREEILEAFTICSLDRLKFLRLILGMEPAINSHTAKFQKEWDVLVFEKKQRLEKVFDKVMG